MAAPLVSPRPLRQFVRAGSLARDWLLTTLLLAALVAALAAAGGCTPLDLALYDQLNILLPSGARDDIALVGISEADLVELGPWPLRHGVYAAFLERLATTPTRAIGLAVPWTRSSDERFVPDAKLADALGAGRDILSLGDSALEPWLARKGNVVLASDPGQAGGGTPPPALAAAAAATGYRDRGADADGLVRWALLAHDSPVGPREHWIAALAGVAGVRGPLPGGAASRLEADGGGLGSHRVGIPLADVTRRFPLYSLAGVLRGTVPLEVLRGRYVLVGLTGPALDDAVSVRSGGWLSAPRSVPRIEVEAALLAAIIDGNAVEPLADEGSALLTALVAIAAMGALGAGRGGAATVCVGAAALCATVVLLFVVLHIWFAPSAALAGIVVALPLWRWRETRHASLRLNRKLASLDAMPGLFGEPGRTRRSRFDDAWRFGAAARALTRAEEVRRFTTRFLEDLEVATFVTDPEGHVVFANLRARDFFAALGHHQLDGAQLPYVLGTFQAEGTGSDFSWWDILDPVLAPNRVKAHAPSGRDVLVTTSIWRAPSGEIAGWLATLVDITAVRGAERLRDAALHFMTGELCAPVQGILKTLRERRGSPEAAFEAVESLAERTLELAEKFVQLSIAESRIYTFSVRPIHESIELAIDANEPRAERQRSTVSFSGPNEPLTALLDPDMIWRAIHTLVYNALRFSPPGAAIAVTLSEDVTAQEINIAVADAGQGIAPGDQARMARLFQNIDLPSAARGAGLGLLFVKIVVERHQGRVEFTSNPGQGTEFRIVLPRVAADAAALAPTA